MSWVPNSVLQKSKTSVIYLALFAALLIALQFLYRGGVHLVELKAETLTLRELPSAMFLSLLRMLLSYGVALLFAFAFGCLAGLTRWGERFLLPMLDILQSVPVVGFFPAAISFFIGITQGHRIGVELAAVFLIFTSQAWNMAFAVYEAIRAIPEENSEAVAAFGLSPSQKFFHLYAPAAIPRLVYNSILSWANGWFFLVACEIIAVGPVKYNLPGIGSFLARAAEEDNINLVLWGLAGLGTLIVLLDVFVWRPLMAWSTRYRQDQTAGDDEDSGEFLDLPKTLFSKLGFIVAPAKKLLGIITFPLRWAVKEMILPLVWDLPYALIKGVLQEAKRPIEPFVRRTKKFRLAVGYFSLGFLAMFGLFYFYHWIRGGEIDPVIRDIPISLVLSTLRILTALTLSFLWIIPLIYFTWNRPRLRTRLTTLAQLGASLPATALFPLIVLIAVKRLGGGMELATLTLLTFGIQWYVLFNAIGGAATLPTDLVSATRSFGLTPFQTFRKLVFPVIRPALITGAITAWGGGWNALVVSEYVNYKDQVLKVRGLGALMSTSVYELGDARTIAVVILVMVAWILFINLIVWQPLYQANLDKYRL